MSPTQIVRSEGAPAPAISRRSMAGSGLAGVASSGPAIASKRETMPLASRISRENGAGLFEASAIRWPRAESCGEDVGDAGQEVRLLDGDLRVPLAEEPHALRRALRPDGVRQELLEAVADHRADPDVRERLLAERAHREGQSVRDRVVAVDQRAVEVEDEKRKSRAQPVFRAPTVDSARSSPARRTTADAMPSQSPKESVGTDPAKGPSETRAAVSTTSGRATPVRTTSIFGIGRDLYPSTRTRSQSAKSRRRTPLEGLLLPEAAHGRPARRDEAPPPPRPRRRVPLRVLAGDVVVGVLGRVLDRPDRQAAGLQARQHLDDDRGLAGVVAAHERDDRGLAVRVEQKRIAAGEKRLRRVEVTRDLGPRFPSRVDDLAVAARTRSAGRSPGRSSYS